MLFVFKGYSCGCSDPKIGVIEADNSFEATNLVTARLGNEGYWLHTLEEVALDDTGVAFLFQEAELASVSEDEDDGDDTNWYDDDEGPF